MRRTLYFLFILFTIATSACTSGKKALQRGNYDEAVYKAINRLRANSTHKKSAETLRSGYPMAQKWHLDRINTIQLSSDPLKWEKVIAEYRILNSFYDEISRCPGCLTIIPAPTRYTREVENTLLKAAEVRYEAGMAALDKARNGNREEAKIAYTHFQEAGKWVANYKDVQQKMEEAEYYAILRVVVEPIPMHSRSLQLSNEFFDNKINEFLLQAPVNRFVRFYTAQEAKNLGIKQPDHIIQLVFDDFVVGQLYMHEKETQLVKDSIVLATYEIDAPTSGSAGGNTEAQVVICHVVSGNRTQTLTVSESALKAHLEHGDKIGVCTGGPAGSPPSKTETNKLTKKVYGSAKANLHVFTKTVESKGLLDFRIIDGYTNRVISQEKMPGVFVWQSQWGYFNGDERALDKKQLDLIKGKELAPPPPQDLFMLFTQPIYNQLTHKISTFYKNY